MTAQRVVGIVNGMGYRIVDVVSKKILKMVGNHPGSSRPEDSLPCGTGVDVQTLKEWCEADGVANFKGWRGARIE